MNANENTNSFHARSNQHNFKSTQAFANNPMLALSQLLPFPESLLLFFAHRLFLVGKYRKMNKLYHGEGTGGGGLLWLDSFSPLWPFPVHCLCNRPRLLFPLPKQSRREQPILQGSLKGHLQCHVPSRSQGENQHGNLFMVFLSKGSYKIVIISPHCREKGCSEKQSCIHRTIVRHCLEPEPYEPIK